MVIPSTTRRRQLDKDKKRPRKFRRLVGAAVGPPWDKNREIVAGAMTVGADHQWDLFLHFIPQADGKPYLFGLDIRPSGIVFMKSMSELPPGGVSARVLQSIDLDKVLDGFRVRGRGAEPDPDLQVPANLPQPGSRPGRRGLSDEFFSWVAVNYLKAAQVDPRAPVLRLHETIGSGYPRDTIKGWVVEARKRGFLAPTTQGKGGGEAGPRLPHLIPSWDVVDDQSARDTLIAMHRQA
jgi:hypothetical protein